MARRGRGGRCAVGAIGAVAVAAMGAAQLEAEGFVFDRARLSLSGTGGDWMACGAGFTGGQEIKEFIVFWPSDLL